ncbi:MAG: GH25 family lysozyme [Eubacteriales bacterium]|nr:GH25 family lysozyme [Eubacteriales bacterium]
MNGIDISSYQKGIDLSVVPCDFVIIKATQGISYRNPDYNRAIEQARKAGKLIGVYHYATGAGAEEEVEHFLTAVQDVIGEALLCLDWETGEDPASRNTAFGDPGYAKHMLDLIAERTGATPVIYMSKSVCRKYGWPQTAAKYPLWMAQYANMAETGYQTHPWTDAQGCGGWSDPIIHQYSSRGCLPGWDGALDLNLAYITSEQWRALAGAATEGTGGDDTSEGEPAEWYQVGGYTLRDLRYGDSGEDVRFAQQLLSAAGYDAGAADGIYGAKTEAALEKFQSDHNLIVLDRNTWEQLI